MMGFDRSKCTGVYVPLLCLRKRCCSRTVKPQALTTVESSRPENSYLKTFLKSYMKLTLCPMLSSYVLAELNRVSL